MALPTKVVEQLSRAPARTPGWSSRILLFSATFLILSLGIFLGIQFGYRPFLEGQVLQLDQEINNFSAQVSMAQQDELIIFYSQLDNLNNLLARQVQTSKVFQWIEANTNTQVQLDNLSFNATTKTLTLSGQARTILNLGEQLNRFQAQPEIMNLQLSQLSLNPASGGWNFSVALSFNGKYFDPSPVTLEPASNLEEGLSEESATTATDQPTTIAPSSSVTSTISIQ